MIDCLLTTDPLNGFARIAVGGGAGSCSPVSGDGARLNRSTSAPLLAPSASDQWSARKLISISFSVGVAPAGISN